MTKTLLAALSIALVSSLGPVHARVGARIDEAGWRVDPAWHDGLAEVCTYDATRTIYGVERRYVATAYTNKERASEASSVKAGAEGAAAVEVFKHHWSERVPTENYDYDLSTMTYTRASDLAPFKLTAATQEDCGASFKEVWRDGDTLRFLESVYFPGSGRREGTVPGGDGSMGEPVFFDALTLTLRDFPFDAPRDLALAVLPSQKDTHSVPFEPVPRTARHAGRVTLRLPAGTIEAHRIDLVRPDGAVDASFWFAADGSAPWLHALVRYEGPGGVTYRLNAHERKAYWER